MSLNFFKWSWSIGHADDDVDIEDDVSNDDDDGDDAGNFDDWNE